MEIEDPEKQLQKINRYIDVYQNTVETNQQTMSLLNTEMASLGREIAALKQSKPKKGLTESVKEEIKALETKKDNFSEQRHILYNTNAKAMEFISQLKIERDALRSVIERGASTSPNVSDSGTFTSALPSLSDLSTLDTSTAVGSAHDWASFQSFLDLFRSSKVKDE